MKRRYLAAGRVLAAGAVIVSFAPIPLAGQAPAATTTTTARSEAWTPPRTPDGQPDLQGVWDYRTITPMERPAALGNKQFFTAEEAAKFEEQENRRQNRDLIDPKKGGAQYPPGGVVPYNEFWYDRGNRISGSRRTSLIIDPPDGRLPPRTPDGQKRADARAAAGRDDQAGRARADSYEDRSLTDRCILGFNAGPPMTPGAYNNNMQIVQTPGYVVIADRNGPRCPHRPAGRAAARPPSRSGWETRAAAGKATRSSSRRRTSSAGRALTDPRRPCASSNASPASIPPRFCTSSRSRIRRHGPDPGRRRFR